MDHFDKNKSKLPDFPMPCSVFKIISLSTLLFHFYQAVPKAVTHPIDLYSTSDSSRNDFNIH